MLPMLAVHGNIKPKNTSEHVALPVEEHRATCVSNLDKDWIFNRIKLK